MTSILEIIIEDSGLYSIGRRSRKAEIVESNICKGNQAKAPCAQVFHTVISLDLRLEVERAVVRAETTQTISREILQ